MDNQEKREEIINIITELSERNGLSEDYCENILTKFEKIYSDDFRHFYSDITALLLNINSRIITDESSRSIDLLGENIRTIYEFAIEKDFKFKEKLGKLNDHITMDSARLKEWSKIIDKSKDLYKDISQTTEKIEETEKKIEETTEKIKVTEKKIDTAQEEAITVKKDLVSIMGIFMGIFSFIQWNFSQYKDLLEYDPFNRVFYILIINSILIFSLYFVFSIIDFIVHKDPRMIKVFFDVNKKTPTKFFYCSGFVYLLFLGGLSFGLYSDSGRKTISKLEKQIDTIKEKYKSTETNYKELLDKKSKEIIELEDQVKSLIKANEEKQKNYEKLLNQKIKQIEILEKNNRKKQRELETFLKEIKESAVNKKK